MVSGESLPRRILVGGGARSGKSALALDLAMDLGSRRAFVATAKALDAEMAERIGAHKRERGDRFETLEEPLDLPGLLREMVHYEVVVVDCLTLWVSNLMAYQHQNSESEGFVEERLAALLEALKVCPAHVIIVSNEVGMGIVPMHPVSRSFRDHIGRAHGRISEMADQVVLLTLGCRLQLKPRLQILEAR